MKLSSTLLLLLLGEFTAAYSSASRELHKQTIELSNQADVSVSIDMPRQNYSIQLNASQTSVDLPLHGSAGIRHSTPEVSYIYIIDTSGSTAEPDLPCTSVLDCVQDFFQTLHDEVTRDGSAKLAAVINFDDEATVSAELSAAEDRAIDIAIKSGDNADYGGTNCIAALNKAIELVESPDNTADSTVVVFAGDGQCNEKDIDDWSGDGDPTEAAKALGKTGAVVHSIAVGDDVNCTEYGRYGLANYLAQIPQNGGACHSIPEPHTLPNLIETIVGASLTGLELQIDGNDTVMTNTPDLPAEGPIKFKFGTTIELDPGSHSICVRATGQDSFDDVASVQDCHDVFVMAPPPPIAGWKVFLIVVVAFAGRRR